MGYEPIAPDCTWIRAMRPDLPGPKGCPRCKSQGKPCSHCGTRVCAGHTRHYARTPDGEVRICVVCADTPKVAA